MSSVISSSGIQEISQNPTASIYHSNNEASLLARQEALHRNPLPDRRREKSRNVHYSRLRRRWRGRIGGSDADQPFDEPISTVDRIVRLFSGRSSANVQLNQGADQNEHVLIVEDDVEDRSARDAEEIQLRANPLYEPVLREESENEEEMIDEYEISQGDEEFSGISCCLPCRRKSFRHRRGRHVPISRNRRNHGCSGDRWWYQDVANDPVSAKERIERHDISREPTPPPLPPPPHGPCNPDVENGVAPALDSVPATTGSTTASVHSQIDYQHYFIPDLVAIYACPYYWGVMDRYEAGEVLANKPSGSFLLRDSAQSNFIFSISFRGRGRTLHARIDVFRHSFSFDCCDPQVAKSPTVMGLLAKYQRREESAGIQQEAGGVIGLAEPLPPVEVAHPVSMYEPTLKQPIFRRQTFSLQDISRAVICTHFSYDQVQQMSIPWNLKNYMNIYHYKHQVGARHVSNES